MSQNVELLYRSYDALNRRDLDAYLALLDPEVEFTPRILEMESGSSFRGHGVEGDAPFEEVWWQAIKAREGKAIWCQNFGTEAEALEAAGLSG